MSEKKMNMIVCGGWNSKIGPGALSDILKDLPKKEDKNLKFINNITKKKK